MIHVVTPQEMSQAEQKAYHDGFSEEQFMDHAGVGVADAVHQYAEKNKIERNVILLCGKGNNGGDAYVAGCRLLKMGYQVTAVHVGHIKEASPLSRKNWELFSDANGKVVFYEEGTKFSFPHSAIIVDGLFGTGFHGTVGGSYASLIKQANNSQLPIIAVDIPSGLNGTTGEVEGVAINATETIFLGYPKKGFFIRDGWNHVGILRQVDFGLPAQYVVSTHLEMIRKEDLKKVFPKMVRNRHKYQAGYVLSVAGSPNMPGAALMASFAALKGGAGVVRLFFPEGMEAELASAPYELIKQPYSQGNIEPILSELEKANAVLVGPGLGITESTRDLLKKLMPKIDKPCVIDADALTWLAEDAYTLPSKAILTPHRGEMQRLLRNSSSSKVLDENFLKSCQEYVEKHQVTLILKGGPSFIFHPGTPYLICPHGDPGMATAGSGDVLTGIVAAFLAQGVSERDAAALAVYIHSIAGEEAAKRKTSYCMVATDIIDCLPDAYRSIARCGE